MPSTSRCGTVEVKSQYNLKALAPSDKETQTEAKSTSTEIATQVNVTQGEYEEENEVTRLIIEFNTLTGFYDNTTSTETTTLNSILDDIVFQIHNNTISPPSKKCFSNFLKQLATMERRVKYSVRVILTDFNMQYLSEFFKSYPQTVNNMEFLTNLAPQIFPLTFSL